MTITNEDRYALQERANSVLGREQAATMMELLPPVGWADVATKSDLDAQSESLSLKLRVEWAAAEQRIRGDLASVDTHIRGDMASMELGIRGDMASMELGIRGDMASMEQVIRGDIASMQQGHSGDMASMERAIGELRVGFEAGLRQFRNRMVVIVVSLVGALAAIVGAMAAFLP